MADPTAEHGNSIIEGLYRRRWALPALTVLARINGPCRQANLLAELVAGSGSMVHFRPFAAAMTYLVEHQLVVRHDLPSLVSYEITDTGRRLHTHLTDLEQAFHGHRGTPH